MTLFKHTPTWILIITASVLAMQAYAASNEIKWNDKDIRWYSYDQGIAEMARTGKKGIIVFYANWCGNCRKYARLYHRPDVIAATNKLIMIRVNVDRQSAINRKYVFDSDYVPRTIALTPKAKVIHSVSTTKTYRYFIPFDHPAYLLQFISRVKAYR